METKAKTEPMKFNRNKNTSVEYKELGKEELLSICHHLFQLLDDIDTYDDMAKDNEKLYRNLVRKAHKRRYEVGETDGYTVIFKPLVTEDK